MATRAEMDAALKKIVVPALREMGFKGSMPHLRRARDGAIDLMTFQFRSYGGAFVVEVGHCAPSGIKAPEFGHIDAAKATTSCLRYRHRVGAKDDDSDHWFDFQTAEVEAVAEQLLGQLRDPALWALVDGFPLGYALR